MDKAYEAVNNAIRCEEVGTLQGDKYEKMTDIYRRVYGCDGVSPTVHTCPGGNTEMKIAEPKGCAIRTRAYAGKEAEIEMGGEVANSLTTVEKDSLVCETQVRIRKITERESFRLMGVKDEDFDRIAKNQSNSSLRHLAGDSIVVNVLMAIFGQMLDGHENDYAND